MWLQVRHVSVTAWPRPRRMITGRRRAVGPTPAPKRGGAGGEGSVDRGAGRDGTGGGGGRGRGPGEDGVRVARGVGGQGGVRRGAVGKRRAQRTSSVLSHLKAERGRGTKQEQEGQNE